MSLRVTSKAGHLSSTLAWPTLAGRWNDARSHAPSLWLARRIPTNTIRHAYTMAYDALNWVTAQQESFNLTQTYLFSGSDP